MKKLKRILLVSICVILASFGLFRLSVYIFDNSTSVKGIEQAKISIIDWDGEGYYVDDYWHTTFDEKSMIKMVKEAGKDMSHRSKWYYAEIEGKFHFRIVYKCLLGLKVTRTYHMDYTELKKLKAFEKLYEAKGFKEKFLLSGTERGKKYCYDENGKKVSKELLKNLDLDFLERKYDQEHFGEEDCEDYSSYSVTLYPKRGDYMDYIAPAIYKTDKHTPKWLKEHGGKY
ncbi:hypothetical protein [Hornefia butyriciproducens]|uniref:Uncharacterized protein n=1 Tax=Hornefia butyriciproducens TaxID=2652293 RepID=A0A6L5Y7U0_9FIRM|nr:hypothetical protein [Hornefia butyriciproducens]MCI7326152.1 hypothetical protein [Clostridiales bacterium]MDY2990437.1 hypothetical protein [Hornefia butyriciproducens]MDY5424064.1 hypothetical protein [Hornefia butyriciproducens]MDY5462792.1 hypothetical protein [Hornefia butyriciproducens]MST52696.1 hypothetical protein [Hornefia butyriciproducens]